MTLVAALVQIINGLWLLEEWLQCGAALRFLIEGVYVVLLGMEGCQVAGDWHESILLGKVAELGELLSLDGSSVLLLEDVELLLLRCLVLAYDRQRTSASVELRTHAMAVPAFDVTNLPNDSTSCWSAGLLLLVHSEALLLELVEVLEFSLPLADHQELLSLRLDCEWVLSILLEVDILVFCEAEGWQHP